MWRYVVGTWENQYASARHWEELSDGDRTDRRDRARKSRPAVLLKSYLLFSDTYMKFTKISLLAFCKKQKWVLTYRITRNFIIYS